MLITPNRQIQPPVNALLVTTTNAQKQSAQYLVIFHTSSPSYIQPKNNSKHESYESFAQHANTYVPLQNKRENAFYCSSDDGCDTTSDYTTINSDCQSRNVSDISKNHKRDYHTFGSTSMDFAETKTYVASSEKQILFSRARLKEMHQSESNNHENNLKCNVCQKTFKRQSNLRIHLVCF